MDAPSLPGDAARPDSADNPRPAEVLCHATVWENRRFLQRVVHYLAEAGIDQFIDLGTGLPTQGNVHEVAQKVISDAHVVYVDGPRRDLRWTAGAPG
ncbi:SAM-dependent methyltransferase [Actinomadura latina]|uniref:SAM-dependent methyltransferase n=1 Tax=Actinomadura latina TaxID=163603 RepID=UPI000A9BB5FF|nr:SAM-dependent methyltransferase [Actinomadura latina]